MLHWQDEPENFMNIARTLMFFGGTDQQHRQRRWPL
jgi:hypothetical protein